ncbi:hypothetical protein [Arthrobacter castelli]|uniref:hypothetical protein n=1 Tax=Arthrobacter castelli TaxID=271431 RepID=UPI0003F7B57D|nr:hypothetical protein [Arthrobacter castelli]
MHEDDGADGSHAGRPSSEGHGGAGEWPEEIDKTGDASVDAILDRLQGLPDMPTASQTQVYGEIHESLRSELEADADSG